MPSNNNNSNSLKGSEGSTKSSASSHMSLSRSSSPGAPGYEPEPIQDLRRAYGGPDGDDFDGHTFTGKDGSEYEDAELIVKELVKRRYTFSSPEMADMYFSALAGVYYHTITDRKTRPPGCTAFSSKKGKENTQALKEIYTFRKKAMGDVETCLEAFTRLKGIFDKLLKGAKESASAMSERGATILKDRLKKIEHYTTYDNLEELKKGSAKIAEEGWTAAKGGARRRASRRAVRKTRKGRRGTRRH